MSSRLFGMTSRGFWPQLSHQSRRGQLVSYARTHLKTRSKEAPIFGRRGLGDVDVGDDADSAGGEPGAEAADEHHPDVYGGDHHEVEEGEERRDEEHGEAATQAGAHVTRDRSWKLFQLMYQLCICIVTFVGHILGKSLASWSRHQGGFNQSLNPTKLAGFNDLLNPPWCRFQESKLLPYIQENLYI